MNGKQAKRLRRAAIGLAATLNEAGRDIKKDGYQIRKHENSFNDKRVGEDGKPIPPTSCLSALTA